MYLGIDNAAYYLWQYFMSHGCELPPLENHLLAEALCDQHGDFQDRDGRLHWLWRQWDFRPFRTELSSEEPPLTPDKTGNLSPWEIRERLDKFFSTTYEP